MVSTSIQPSIGEVQNAFTEGKPQLVWKRLPADLDTPVSAMLRLMQDDAPCFLLESVEKGEIRGRYSVIGLRPDVMWRCFGERAEIAHAEHMDDANFSPCDAPALESLRALKEASRVDIPDDLPPMAASLVGYMSYDMVRLMEQLPEAKPDPLAIPDGVFIRPKVMVIFDAVTDTLTISTTIWPDDKRGDAHTAYKAACARIEKVEATLATPHHAAPHTSGASIRMEDFTSNTSRDEYDAMVGAAQEHMLAGDIFQVVLSQRFSADYPLPPFALYRALRYLNPSPFLFYLNFSAFQLVGSSPEILVRVMDDDVTIRPIAGTRKRGANKTEDAALAADLLSDEKELAEHLMLLDLGRNDVGRVAKIGSVRTTKQMEIENYSHVMHIVSNVVGQLDTDKHDALSALIAGFPAGTTSGAPKVRAMEIINDLEVHKRSFYAGSIGYFSGNGNMDTAIALRTGLIKDGKLHVQAGGGVVAASTAEGEYQESVNKAKALMRAAELAKDFV